MHKILESALDKLGEEFLTLDFSYYNLTKDGNTEKVFYWLGTPDESIKICVSKSKTIQEPFHRQDFFYFNFAYKNSYNALSSKYDNQITIHENECYIGQPFSGYALRGNSKEDIIIIGVLIQKSSFFREYLPTLSCDSSLFHFFLDPQTNSFSEEFIHLSFKKAEPIRTLLELMVLEYANNKEDTQDILKPMVLTLLMYIARRYREENTSSISQSLSDQMLQYMNSHPGTVSLKEIASHFSYHPNYISSLLHKETGLTFSELLLQSRMDRAVVLLKETNLNIEEIANMLGYGNSSNFYKAFRKYYHQSPRDYIQK